MMGLEEKRGEIAEIARDEDDADEAISQRHCVDCRVASPKTHTAHTLISTKYGWRLTRRRETAGGYAFEWRCPDCWATYKIRNREM